MLKKTQKEKKKNKTQVVLKRFLQNQTIAFEAQRGKQPLEKIESIIINLSEEKEIALAIFFTHKKT